MLQRTAGMLQRSAGMLQRSTRALLSDDTVLAQLGLLCLQAEMLGRRFRSEMYPEDGADPGQGLLRLHSTYRYVRSFLDSQYQYQPATVYSATCVPLRPQGSAPSPLLALAADSSRCLPYSLCRDATAPWVPMPLWLATARARRQGSVADSWP